jgi:hypothetical protein
MAMKDTSQRNTSEREKKFKWICCDETFTTVSKGGCKKGKHGFFLNNIEPLGQQMANRKSNQRKQATLEQWEDACCANDEYNQKWLLLDDI